MELTREIVEIINKNLPSSVGDLLKKRLEQADKDAERVRELEVEREKLLVRINDYQKSEGVYAYLNAREVGLNNRDAEISERERNQKVFEAELKAAEADKRAAELAGFVGMVFRSPVYRKTINAPYIYSSTGLVVGGGTTTEEKTEE